MAFGIIKDGSESTPTSFDVILNNVANQVTEFYVIENGVSTLIWPDSVTKTFNYTGNVQRFVVPITGVYKLEVWGAQGGNCQFTGKSGGLGGYSVGVVSLTAGETIYIVVGGQGNVSQTGATSKQDYVTSLAGYNGGGDGRNTYNQETNLYFYAASGGGCTHIGTFNSVLSEHGNTEGLFIVAGGGGGAGGNSTELSGNGGSGGGTNGENGSCFENLYFGTGATQTAGGIPYTEPELSVDYDNGSFGLGGISVGGGAGGGGLYGGGAGNGVGGGGGGSGYIGGVSESSTTNGVRSGHGLAVITLVS